MLRNAFVVCALFLSACATMKNQSEVKPSPETLSRLEKVTTIEAIQTAEESLKRSKEKALDFYAPDHFTLANQAVAEARVLLSGNQPRDKIVNKVAVAETVIQNGDIVMRKVKTVLGDELTLKQNLDALNTAKIYGGEYGSLLQRLEEIIRQVENGKLAEVTDSRTKLKKDMGALQARAIRHNALHEAEEILKRVNYSGGPKLAPFAYDEAQAVLTKADQFITANPQLTDAVDKAGKEALFAAKRALYITQEVAALSTKANTSLEQIVLDEEYRIARIARALDVNDVRDNPLEVQSEKIAKIVADLVEQSRKQEDLVVALRDTLIKVRDSATVLSSNQVVKQLRKEKSEWLAKDALYSAKLTQMNAELMQKESELSRLHAVAAMQTPRLDTQESVSATQTIPPVEEVSPVASLQPSTDEDISHDVLTEKLNQVIDESAPMTATFVDTGTDKSSLGEAVNQVIEQAAELQAVDAAASESELLPTDSPEAVTMESKTEVIRPDLATQIKSLAESD